MEQIQKECNKRKISRLCHFTQSRNLSHIFDNPYNGLLSTRTLRQNKIPYNPSDPSRYDGRDDLICCSIEYPNVYYFDIARQRDKLFRDWVILLIKPCYLWHQDTFFCPINAARFNGKYIKNGYEGFCSLFSDRSPGNNYQRHQTHLSASPTDIQAEVLIKDPIPLDNITGIVVQSEEQAKKEMIRLKIQGIKLDKSFIISPYCFQKSSLRNCIHNGNKVPEKLYSN